MKIVMEGVLDEVDREDGGMALIGHGIEENPEHEGFFVRLQSWDETKEHKTFNQLRDRKLRVTVEVID